MKKTISRYLHLPLISRDAKLPLVNKDFGSIKQCRNKSNIDLIILRYLLTKYQIKSMVDIGCGLGEQVELAREEGLRAIGIDGDPSLPIHYKEGFIKHDYTKGPLDAGEFDLCWVVELLEHVKEKFISNLFGTIKKCKMVCCTHALPGKAGMHHVNCQPTSYWIDIFKQNGFKYDKKRTIRIRNKAESKWIKRSGLIFINKYNKIEKKKD